MGVGQEYQVVNFPGPPPSHPHKPQNLQQLPDPEERLRTLRTLSVCSKHGNGWLEILIYAWQHNQPAQ